MLGEERPTAVVTDTWGALNGQRRMSRAKSPVDLPTVK